MAKTLEELLAQGKTTPYDELLKRQTSSPSQLIDDGGFTRNVIMKGIPGMEDSSPSFSGLGGVSWPPPGIPVTQDDLPPSPISPDIQSLFPAAKISQEQSFGIENTPDIKQPQTVGKKSQSKEQPLTAIEAEQPVQEAPKEQSTLEKLLASYSQEDQPDAELAQLQKDRANRQMMLDLIGAGTQLTSGLASAKYDPNLLNKFYERADQDITDLMARRKSEKEKKQSQRDEIKFAQDIEKYQMDKDKYQQQLQDDKAVRNPASEVSQTTKHAIADMLSKIGRKDQADKILNSKLSHKQLEDVYGQMNIQNYISMYEAQQNRLQTAKLAAEARKDAAELKKEEKATEKKEKATTDFRKELTSSGNAMGKAYANYLNADRSYNTIQQYLKNPSGYKDYASIMGSLKALQGDESVVREAEVRMGMQATSLPNKIKNWTDSMATGKMLQPEQRKQMADAVNVLRAVASDQFRRVSAPVMAQAERLGLDPKEILGTDFSETKQEPLANLSDYASGAAAELARRRGNK